MGTTYANLTVIGADHDRVVAGLAAALGGGPCRPTSRSERPPTGTRGSSRRWICHAVPRDGDTATSSRSPTVSTVARSPRWAVPVPRRIREPVLPPLRRPVRPRREHGVLHDAGPLRRVRADAGGAAAGPGPVGGRR